MTLADRPRFAGFGVAAFTTLLIAVLFATFAARPVAFLAGISEPVAVLAVLFVVALLVFMLLD